MRCEAKNEQNGKQCKFGASKIVNGHEYCGNHARRIAASVPATLYQRPAPQPVAAPERKPSDLISTLSCAEMAAEVRALIAAGVGDVVVAAVLDGWRGQ